MGDVPAPASRFGRAPGAWPLLGHMVALQRRPLALLDTLPGIRHEHQRGSDAVKRPVSYPQLTLPTLREV
jgi:hypothetical protein